MMPPMRRNNSFDAAIPSLPPFLLGPAPLGKTVGFLERMVQGLQPILGGTMTQVLVSSLAGSSRAIEKFRADCFWHFMCWLLNPNAILLLLFWPGWFLIALVWLWWTW